MLLLSLSMALGIFYAPILKEIFSSLFCDHYYKPVLSFPISLQGKYVCRCIKCGRMRVLE